MRLTWLWSCMAMSVQHTPQHNSPVSHSFNSFVCRHTDSSTNPLRSKRCSATGSPAHPPRSRHRVPSAVLLWVYAVVWYLCFGWHGMMLSTFKSSYPNFAPLVNAFYTSNFPFPFGRPRLRNTVRSRSSIHEVIILLYS